MSGFLKRSKNPMVVLLFVSIGFSAQRRWAAQIKTHFSFRQGEKKEWGRNKQVTMSEYWPRTTDKKRRQSVTSLKVRLPWNRLFPPTLQDVRWCCLLNIPDTMPPGGPQVNFACYHRLRCRFHRWVTPISDIIYTTPRQVCQELFVKNIYFCLFRKWQNCENRQGRF